MNKKLILKISTIVVLNFNNPYELINASEDKSMTLPQDEKNIWKWSPFRMGSHLLWGQKLGQDFWETNSSELGTALAQFKKATSDEEKSQILKKVMQNSAKAYENVIEGLQGNYRTAMSYIIERFQNESPDSTIIYFPDNKLVAMYKKNASDEEKYKIMYDLLKNTKQAVEDKKKSSLSADQGSQAGSVHQPNPHSTTTTTTTTTTAQPKS